VAIVENVSGTAAVAITGNATGQDTVGVRASGDAVGVHGDGRGWNGVQGVSESTTGGAGVYGRNDNGAGVRGETRARFNPGVHGVHHGAEGWGVYGEANSGTGVSGRSDGWVGVYGESLSTTGGAGLWGEHKSNGTAIVAVSLGGAAVVATTKAANAPVIAAMQEHPEASGTAIFARAKEGEALHAETNSRGVAAVAAYNNREDGTGAAIYARKVGDAGHAGFFDGNVHVEKKLTVKDDIILTGADCAEDFSIDNDAEVAPGTVMVVADSGRLTPSSRPYDRRVAGVVSGAGPFKPAIVLDKRHCDDHRRPIALVGKVFCNVDTAVGPIAVGDLLTTSATPGFAMKAADRDLAFGAVIGKALAPLATGRGMIPILVALQ